MCWIPGLQGDPSFRLKGSTGAGGLILRASIGGGAPPIPHRLFISIPRARRASALTVRRERVADSDRVHSIMLTAAACLIEALTAIW
jgi:hypothetical protein